MPDPHSHAFVGAAGHHDDDDECTFTGGGGYCGEPYTAHGTCGHGSALWPGASCTKAPHPAGTPHEDDTVGEWTDDE